MVFYPQIQREGEEGKERDGRERKRTHESLEALGSALRERKGHLGAGALTVISQ